MPRSRATIIQKAHTKLQKAHGSQQQQQSILHPDFEQKRTADLQMRIQLREWLPLVLKEVYEQRCLYGQGGQGYTLNQLLTNQKYRQWEIDFMEENCQNYTLLSAVPRFRKLNDVSEMNLEVLPALIMKMYETVMTPVDNCLKLKSGMTSFLCKFHILIHLKFKQ